MSDYFGGRKLTCSKCRNRKEVRRYRQGYCGACHNAYVKRWAKIRRGRG